MSRTANSEAIQKMNREIQVSWDEGFKQGVLEADNPIPPWFFTKTLSSLKPYEAGYYVGRQAERLMREPQELEGEQSCTDDIDQCKVFS